MEEDRRSTGFILDLFFWLGIPLMSWFWTE